ncbi:unnamed protein product [Zymoseptoria tritici ST99CH_1A5]|uniref:Uncharacterized protein n=1 Tax=Zymoseptoria tritici ST99CH_1A5 TaxID=1276529 RepID=A0A1Y6LB55_ZYMTR|nr:unnamed protein product [Zymoseptoria tritici ST99CH_1A5]
MYETFELRLRETLSYLKDLNDLDTTLQWAHDLESYSVEEFASEISNFTLPAAKAIFDAPHPPNVDTIQSLRPVEGSQSPGVYLGFTQDVSGKDAHNFAYTGSATRVARGLSTRTNQHLDPEYRVKYLEKRPNYYHYLLFAGTENNREEVYYVLAETEFASTDPDEINKTRIFVTLFEQICICWLRCYTSKAAAGAQKKFAGLCLWPGQSFAYSGVNQASPICNDISRADTAAAGLTIAEQNTRAADRLRIKRQNWSAEEEEVELGKRVDYNEVVTYPIRKFKNAAIKAGMSKKDTDAVIKVFRKAARLAKKAGTVPPEANDYLVVKTK